MTTPDEIIDAEEALIDLMLEKVRKEGGTVVCSTCDRECAEGTYMISLMGHGARCTRFDECAAEFNRQVAAGSERMMDCYRCHRELPITALHLQYSRNMASCVDVDGCKKAREIWDAEWDREMGRNTDGSRASD